MEIIVLGIVIFFVIKSGIVSGAIDMSKKIDAVCIIVNLLQHQKSLGNFHGDVDKTAREYVEAAWDYKPDVFNGKFGQRPHKLSTAIFALALACSKMDPFGDRNAQGVAFALCGAMEEVGVNGSLYPFQSIDREIICWAMKIVEPIEKSLENFKTELNSRQYTPPKNKNDSSIVEEQNPNDSSKNNDINYYADIVYNGICDACQKTAVLAKVQSEVSLCLIILTDMMKYKGALSMRRTDVPLIVVSYINFVHLIESQISDLTREEITTDPEKVFLSTLLDDFVSKTRSALEKIMEIHVYKISDDEKKRSLDFISTIVWDSATKSFVSKSN